MVNFSMVKTGVALLVPVQKQEQHFLKNLTSGVWGANRFFLPTNTPSNATNRLKQAHERRKHAQIPRRDDFLTFYLYRYGREIVF